MPDSALPANYLCTGPLPREAAAQAVVDDPLELARHTRWLEAPDGSRRGQSALLLSGLHCAACAGLIEAALRRVPGVEAVQVSGAAQRASVRWDPTRTQLSALLAAVQGAGYGAVPDHAASAHAQRRAERRLALWRLFVAAFCMMQVMMLATPSYVAGAGELAPDLAALLNWGQWLLSLPVLLFSAGPFFAGAWRALRRGRVAMDGPVALGVAITFVASSGATFDPAGPFGHEVFFDSLTMFVAFLLGARYVELLARQRAAEQLEAETARLPQTAWRLRADGGVDAVSVQRLRAGDRLRVPLGEAFPADGVLLDGATQADESLLTGESLPVAKAIGDELVGGSLNLGAPATMRVLRAGADTRLQAIVAMMQDALAQRPEAARLADRWAAPFLLAVLLLAGGAALAWSWIDPTRALWVAVAVLIVTCPCALSLAAPATLVATARAMARRGVLLQRLDAIEALAGVQRVLLDKTGTLTDERPVLTAVHPAAADGLDGATLLALASSLAAHSRHPLSRALVDAATRSGASAAPGAWRDVRETPGAGLQACDEAGRNWRLGTPDWAGGGGAAARGRAGASVRLARDGVPLADFAFSETLRDGAAQAVAALRARGLQVELLSGDAAERVQAVARRLGIARVHAAASPQGKLAVVAAAQAQGLRVAMVGDGINDAPVLARADASLAMGQGALAARGSADAVIVSNQLADLVHAHALACRGMAIVRQNLAWAASYNALAIPLALVGWLPPWAAGLGMALSSLAVVLNALRAGR